ncbi:MAG: DUF5674 family protein [Bacteroidota bacterium]
MSEIKILSSQIPVSKLKELAAEQFIDMIKAVVDIEKKIMTVGGSLHSDEEKEMIKSGSEQFNLWGINIYFDVNAEDRIEFDSMINIRPTQENRTRGVENPQTREKIISIVNKLIQF